MRGGWRWRDKRRLSRPRRAFSDRRQIISSARASRWSPTAWSILIWKSWRWPSRAFEGRKRRDPRPSRTDRSNDGIYTRCTALQRYVAPAVDVDRFPRHIGRLCQQEMHGLGDVLGRAFALERSVRDDALTGELVEGFVVGPQDRTRRDRVDADFRRELSRERARQSHQPRLGDAVHDVILERGLGVDVGDVDDRPE